MARTTIEHRRKIREMEAKRDRLLQAQEKAKHELAKTRAELRSQRKSGAK